VEDSGDEETPDFPGYGLTFLLFSAGTGIPFFPAAGFVR
jgi:choline-glycine betaine transporter